MRCSGIQLPYVFPGIFCAPSFSAMALMFLWSVQTRIMIYRLINTSCFRHPSLSEMDHPTHPFKNAGDDIGEQLIVEVISIYDGFIAKTSLSWKIEGRVFFNASFGGIVFLQLLIPNPLIGFSTNASMLHSPTVFLEWNKVPVYWYSNKAGNWIRHFSTFAQIAFGHTRRGKWWE